MSKAGKNKKLRAKLTPDILNQVMDEAAAVIETGETYDFYGLELPKLNPRGILILSYTGMLTEMFKYTPNPDEIKKEMDKNHTAKERKALQSQLDAAILFQKEQVLRSAPDDSFTTTIRTTSMLQTVVYALYLQDQECAIKFYVNIKRGHGDDEDYKLVDPLVFDMRARALVEYVVKLHNKSIKDPEKRLNLMSALEQHFEPLVAKWVINPLLEDRLGWKEDPAIKSSLEDMKADTSDQKSGIHLVEAPTEKPSSTDVAPKQT